LRIEVVWYLRLHADTEGSTLIPSAASYPRKPGYRSWHTFVEPPAPAHRTLTATELFLNLWGILDHPAVEGGMIDGNPSLAPHLL
jgi:hypothetical protein